MSATSPASAISSASRSVPEATTSRFEPGRTRPVPTLGLIHNSPMLAAVFNEIAARVMPDVRILHFVDESTLKNTIAAGRLDKATMRQLIRLVGSTFDADGHAELVAGSSTGSAGDSAAMHSEP